MVSPPVYQPYLDVAPDAFRWRLGLRRLDLADWFEIDDDYPTDLDRKTAVMREHPTTAFRVLPDIDAESVEIRDAIVAHLARLGDDRVPQVDASLHPLDAAARLVQEDLVVLVERDARVVCGGGSVCFPNRWDLASKVGRTMAEIHAPVAQLNDQLEAPIDGFLHRLTPDRSFWRLGWGVIDTDELYQPTDGTAPDAAEHAADPTGYFVRVERETLRRMPQTGCILFTIRTHIHPLTAVPPGHDAATLAAAIDGLPDDVADYKGLRDVADRISGWLRQRATTSVQ